MSKRQFKSQASSSRAVSGAGFGGFVSAASSSTLSYLNEPPNLSSIDDPHVVVAFKNLLKKDSTTKAKGLEELRSYVQSHPYEQDGGVEEATLVAWVKLFPRISIDNSRRVRELSQNLQFELLNSARKRMEKHIPNIVGAWLAGTYDRDRPVARAATDGITSFFDTERKVLLFWRRCQVQILEYAQSAIEETPQSLSDERTVSSDDAQAKYHRVIGSSLSLVVNLLLKLDQEDIEKQQEKYHRFLAENKTLWGFIASKDAFVRRVLAQLMQICLSKQKKLIEMDLEIVSQAFIAEGLGSVQSGSALAFLQALDQLTIIFPHVWTTFYKGKKGPVPRLQYFVERGSQGGPPEYWQTLGYLITRIPANVLPPDVKGSEDFLRAYRHGISNKDEIQQNSALAWSSYFDVVKHVSESMSAETSNELLRVAVFPAFEQYLRPNSETSRWSMDQTSGLLAKAFSLCALSKDSEDLIQEWQKLAEALITSMVISLPEQSKDYSKSQDAIVSEARRWFGLQAEILISAKGSNARLESITKFLTGPSTSIVTNAIELLIRRNGKPYGAAGVIEAALRLTPELIVSETATWQIITSFFNDEAPKYLTSPSSKFLIASLNAIQLLQGQYDLFKSSWKSAIGDLLAAPSTTDVTEAIMSLTASYSVSKLAQNDNLLQDFLFTYSAGVIEGKSENWSLFESSLSFDSLGSATCTKIVFKILQCLDENFANESAPLRALEIVSQKKPHLLRDDDSTYLAVMTQLLAITEMADNETSSRANLLKMCLEGKNSNGQLIQGSSPLISIIRESLESAGLQSLSIDTLVRQALGVLESNDKSIIARLLPRLDIWNKFLICLLDREPNPALSLTSLLGGSVTLIHNTSTEPISQLTRDLSGYSIPFRMALYTTKILPSVYPLLAPDDQVNILQLIGITYEVASDQLGLQEKNKLWSSLSDPETDSEVQEFISSAGRNMKPMIHGATSWRDPASQENSAVARKLVFKLIEESRGSSTKAYYAARVLANVLTNLVETHGWQSSGAEDWLTSLNVLKTSTPDLFTATAILSGLRETLGPSKIVNNLCNRLISDIAGASIGNPKTLGLLVLLNSCLQVYEPEELPVAHNRLVFAVKQITVWLGHTDVLPPSIAAEAFRSLQNLLPSIKEVYGSYWETSLRACTALWNKEVRNGLDFHLSELYASLKLVTVLKSLEEVNDDLPEALAELAQPLSEGFIRLLTLPRVTEHQPLRIFDELLARQASKIPLKHVNDITVLYSLVASDFCFVQSAAYEILHRAIPAAQEQISIDALIEDTSKIHHLIESQQLTFLDAQLPEELLSLLLDAPSMQKFPEDVLVDFPSPIRSYLLSWHLIFDSYTNAVPKVRSEYSDRLKTENVMGPLLDFMFDILGHSAANSLNLVRENFSSEMIRCYDLRLAEVEPGERNMYWLLVNLYYLALKLTPNHVKNWWIDLRSKQTRISVESWTEKYISPLVISDTLEDVSNWADNQEVSSDEKELIVKVSKKSREVFAGYEVDEVMSQIVVRLPHIYPLEGVKVESVNRVAVSEKKWQSWLMITQGVITFSNGSLTDGLVAFRKNVTGAMKGQTECAICYSIVSSDKRTPDKRCQTCKHLFHSSCLFKWFSTSNQSTCPLCRNPFTFAGDGSKRGGMGPRRNLGGAARWEL